MLGEETGVGALLYSNGFLTAIPSFATSISYHPNTMVNRIAHANAVNVDHTIDPDNIHRPRQIALSNANGSWTYGNYAYDGAGNIKAIGSDTYVYDKVSRLTSGSFATASCGAKSQTASYNPFGYMTSTTTTDWGTQTFTEAASGLYNRISPGTSNYDAAGNMLSWSTYSYTWNRLNQMLTANSGASHTFLYTLDGERVSDRVGTNKTLTIRDLSNKVLRIYSYNGSAWSWSKDYVYREGQLLATVEPPFASQVVKHVHLDHLGTPRRITAASRNIVAAHDYYPFGMEACGTADSERMKFTSHERDLQGTASQTDDLDYMHARYYNPNIARFLSVDSGETSASAPQGWNRFAFGLGNSLKYLDPDGRAPVGATEGLGLWLALMKLQAFETGFFRGGLEVARVPGVDLGRPTAIQGTREFEAGAAVGKWSAENQPAGLMEASVGLDVFGVDAVAGVSVVNLTDPYLFYGLGTSKNLSPLLRGPVFASVSFGVVLNYQGTGSFRGGFTTQSAGVFPLGISVSGNPQNPTGPTAVTLNLTSLVGYSATATYYFSAQGGGGEHVTYVGNGVVRSNGKLMFLPPQ